MRVEHGYSQQFINSTPKHRYESHSQVVEDKTGQDRVYTKWKPPKNKLTQEIQRKKGAKRKSIVPDASVDRFCEPGEF